MPTSNLRALYHNLIPLEARLRLRQSRQQLFDSLRLIYHRLVPLTIRLSIRDLRLKLLAQPSSPVEANQVPLKQSISLPTKSSEPSPAKTGTSKQVAQPVDTGPLARKLDATYFARRNPLTQKLMEQVRSGENFYQVMQGFRGKDYDDRVVEYPYFVTWLLRQETGQDILDVGCVLNNKLVSNILKERCKRVWLSNLVVESQVFVQNSVFYHLAGLHDAFPDGEQFPLVTCLSTIEHIGYDNSQYGSKISAKYTEPALEPLTQSLHKLGMLVAPGGELLVSVPFGYREAVTHPATGKKSSQIFDATAIEAGMEALHNSGIATEFEVMAATEQGWEIAAPKTCQARYADGTPAAGAVAFITGKKD